jgi:hypothetical protein
MGIHGSTIASGYRRRPTANGLVGVGPLTWPLIPGVSLGNVRGAHGARARSAVVHGAPADGSRFLSELFRDLLAPRLQSIASLYLSVPTLLIVPSR